MCAKAARLFEGMGAVVEEAAIDLHDAEETFQTLRAAEFVGSYLPILDAHRDQLKPEIIWNIEKGLQLTASEIERAELARGALFHRTAEFFSRYDLLLCPAATVPPLRRGYTLRNRDQRHRIGQLHILGFDNLRHNADGVSGNVGPLRIHPVGLTGGPTDGGATG